MCMKQRTRSEILSNRLQMTKSFNIIYSVQCREWWLFSTCKACMSYIGLSKQVCFYSREFILTGSTLYPKGNGNYNTDLLQTGKNELILCDSYRRYRYQYLEHSSRWTWWRVITLPSFILGNTKFLLILCSQTNKNKD